MSTKGARAKPTKKKESSSSSEESPPLVQTKSKVNDVVVAKKGSNSSSEESFSIQTKSNSKDVVAGDKKKSPVAKIQNESLKNGPKEKIEVKPVLKEPVKQNESTKQSNNEAAKQSNDEAKPKEIKDTYTNQKEEKFASKDKEELRPKGKYENNAAPVKNYLNEIVNKGFIELKKYKLDEGTLYHLLSPLGQNVGYFDDTPNELYTYEFGNYYSGDMNFVAEVLVNSIKITLGKASTRNYLSKYTTENDLFLYLINPSIGIDENIMTIDRKVCDDKNQNHSTSVRLAEKLGKIEEILADTGRYQKVTVTYKNAHDELYRLQIKAADNYKSKAIDKKTVEDLSIAYSEMEVKTREVQDIITGILGDISSIIKER